jgi:general secretion pathway protein J
VKRVQGANRHFRKIRSITGSTLIEMVVALTLMALLALGLFEGLRFTQRAYAKTVVEAEATWQIFTAQRWLRSVLESAYPQEPMDRGVEFHHGVEGTHDEVRVIAPAAATLSGGGFYRYHIAARPGSQGRRDIVVSWEPEMPSSAHRTDQMAEVLVENISDVEWSYYANGNWSPSWQAQRQLPQLIRMSVTFAPGDPRRWPELFVVPRVTDDANCTFDVVAQRCRDSI